MNLIFDFLAPVCIHHSVSSLLVGGGGRTNMRDHNRLAIPPEGLLEDPGEFGVTVVDVVGVAGAQGIDAVG